MTIGFYTSKHYYDMKKAAVEEAAKRLGIEASVVLDESFSPSLTNQTFGFEELFQRTKHYAAEGLKRLDADVGIGIENSLSFIYSAKEWFYVICIALQTRDGRSTASFTPGIGIPESMMKEVQEQGVKIDALTQRLAGKDDPVVYFSGGALTRKDLMIPPLLLAFGNLGLQAKKDAENGTIKS